VGIKWYRAPPGAKVFPGYSRFGIGYWANQDYDWFGPGQQLPKPLEYDKGICPPNVTGQSFCGSLQDFAEGGLYDPTLPPVVYDQYGIPTCCPGFHPIPPFAGGILQEDGNFILQENGWDISLE
jgi:hypothetical protein